MVHSDSYAFSNLVAKEEIWLGSESSKHFCMTDLAFQYSVQVAICIWSPNNLLLAVALQSLHQFCFEPHCPAEAQLAFCPVKAIQRICQNYMSCRSLQLCGHQARLKKYGAVKFSKMVCIAKWELHLHHKTIQPVQDHKSIPFWLCKI